MVKNAYIHIPFCKQKCKYCSFISFPKIELKNEYINALIKDINTNYNKENLSTIYFGGGTPSLLTIDDFSKILQQLHFDNKTEITVEINPETVNNNYLKELKSIGVNRLSIGCQTFNDNILQQIGRRHSSQDVIKTVHLAQDNNFDNISLDFIYGLPNQSIQSFANDLETAAKLEIQHISLYGLKIDEGCYYYNNRPQNLPDEDTQADMYIQSINTLKKQNFVHYEISNFAKKGYESQHNLNYWNNSNYYGFGCGAHGYKNNIRYSKSTNINEYITNPKAYATEHVITEQEKLEEEIFLGLRKITGINIKEINNKFGINFRKKYANQIKRFTELQYLLETNEGYKLSENGILLSNNILCEFLE